MPRPPSPPRESAETRDRRRRTSRREEQERWKLSLLAARVATQGWDSVGDQTVVAPGVQLGRWVARARNRKRRGRLSAWLHDGLEAIPGWSWEPILDRQREVFTKLRRYVDLAAGLSPPARVGDIHALGKWIRMRRQDEIAGRLAPQLRAQLEAIRGWTWEQSGSLSNKPRP